MIYLIAVFVLSISWLLQLFVIFPLEAMLRPQGNNLEAFSLLFLPHGAKVLIAMFLMGSGVPLIMVVTFVFGLFWHPPEYALIGGVIAGATAILPLWGVNLAIGRPLNYRFFAFRRDNVNLFKLAMVMSVAIAVLNSFFQSLHAKVYLNINPDPLLALWFLFGDIVGGVVCILFCIMVARLYLQKHKNVF
jgi:hypothetical protein